MSRLDIPHSFVYKDWTNLPLGPERVGVSCENTPVLSLGGSPGSLQSSLTSLKPKRENGEKTPTMLKEKRTSVLKKAER